MPVASPKSTFNSFVIDTLNLGIPSTRNNGGSPIVKYKLYRYNSVTSDFDLTNTLSQGSLTYSATAGTDGYEIGSTYRFRVVVENGIGNSKPSDEAYIAFGDAPPQPPAIDASKATTSSTWIKVKWDAVTAPLSGSDYVLNIDDAKDWKIRKIYIGMNKPDLREYTVSGLTTGLPHRFTLQAINPNDRSISSDPTTLYACDKPDGLTTQPIELSWNSPVHDVGCPFSGIS